MHNNATAKNLTKLLWKHQETISLSVPKIYPMERYCIFPSIPNEKHHKFRQISQEVCFAIWDKMQWIMIPCIKVSFAKKIKSVRIGYTSLEN